MKSQYSMHKIDETVNIFMKSKFVIYFISDANAGYWTISTKKKNVHKTNFITFHEQWAYFRMKMDLTETSHTYAQFTNLMFESLPTIDKKKTKFTIIKNHENETMISFANDHSCAIVEFEKFFIFLHTKYFSRITFGSIYLNPKKTHAFIKKLNMMKFSEESNGIKSSIKHKIKIEK